jgi:septal ring factor EnvC (AmiA/AmiB activator)
VQEEIRKRLGGKDDKSSPANARRQELRDQLSSLRTEQASAKSSRGKILDQIKALNDGIATKVRGPARELRCACPI